MKLIFKIALGIFALSPVLVLLFEAGSDPETLSVLIQVGFLTASLFTIPIIMFLASAYSLYFKNLTRGGLMLALMLRAILFVAIFNGIAVLLAWYVIPGDVSDGWIAILVPLYAIGNLIAAIPVAVVTGLLLLGLKRNKKRTLLQAGSIIVAAASIGLAVWLRLKQQLYW